MAATVAVGNTANQAVVRRAGFRLDGVLRSGQLVRGHSMGRRRPTGQPAGRTSGRTGTPGGVKPKTWP